MHDSAGLELRDDDGAGQLGHSDLSALLFPDDLHMLLLSPKHDSSHNARHLQATYLGERGVHHKKVRG